MQINKINLTTDKCKKPCQTPSFKRNDFELGEQSKVRYKHFEGPSDDVIAAKSIVKAHQNAQKSTKMHLYKAIPAIATGIIGTSLAIAQPGKISAKAATGLGFLATIAGVNAIGDLTLSKDEAKHKKAYATLGSMATIGAGAMLMATGAGKASKINNFIAKESAQLAKEINSTKLAKLSDKYLEPFIQKHPKFEFIAPLATAISTSVLGSLASVGLLKGISKDIKQNACDMFEKAKNIQQIAREDFDKIDAIEV